MRGFYVKVKANVRRSAMSPEDASLIGVHYTQVENDEIPEGAAVGAVLDRFHNQFGIDNVDDLSLYVFNEYGEAVFEDDTLPPVGEEAAEDFERASRLPRKKKRYLKRH